MSFGTDLSKEFHKLTNGVMLDEVCLFTKLQDTFINLKANSKYHSAIDIIHGNKSLVEFKFNSSWASKITPRQSVIRELADMLFVIYSPRKRIIRITYMQNKKGTTANKFKADLCQLHLLSQRERIISTPLPECLFGDPEILSSALLPSVGSYGVFYKDNIDIEMSYYPAKQIHPCQDKGKSVVRTAEYDQNNFNKPARINGYDEIQGTSSLKDFGDALVNMQIGTPITSGMVVFKELIIFLLDNVESLRQSPWFNEYGDYLDANDRRYQHSPVPVTYAINIDKDRKSVV